MNQKSYHNFQLFESVKDSLKLLENVNFQYEFAQDDSLDMKLISNHCPNGQFSIPTRIRTEARLRGILSPLRNKQNSPP